ncbi:sialic acid-binding Ig-like lectin 10 [Ochotona princeps]|uniref:sialic acid-binding Ig-like lectin 10 n=1 Tax=Ochotona princeps TaxID=9978 RepID=UPI0027144AA7|nr:sialic acid-binding Ig-like lectin 10 [Ochotona princeps]
MLLLLLLSLLSDGSRAQDWWYKVQVPSPMKVQEGLCVFLPCSVEYPKDGWTDTTPAYGYWFTRLTDTLKGAPVATNHPDREVQESARGRFLLVGDPSKYNCSLLLREARREDMGLYVFRLERGERVKYNFKQWLMLEVTALTQKPDIFIPEALEPGWPVKALCVFNLTSELCPAPTFSWTGAAVTTQGIQLRSAHHLVLSFTPRLQDQDQDTELTCRVDFSLSARSTQETVHLHFASGQASIPRG